MTLHRDGVVERAFGLLGCFDEKHTALTLAELSRRAALPVNSTLRIARNLMAVGALERNDDGRFSVGLRLFEIAALAPRGVGLRPASLPYLVDLRDLTGQHALLTVREGDEAVLVERLSAPAAARVQYRIGGRLPLASTGAGLVLLAFAPADVQERAATGTWIDGPVAHDDLRHRLAEIRQIGCAVGSRAEIDSVAVPVRNAGNEVVAALSVVGGRGSIDPRALISALMTGARAISRDAFRRT